MTCTDTYSFGSERDWVTETATNAVAVELSKTDEATQAAALRVSSALVDFKVWLDSWSDCHGDTIIAGIILLIVVIITAFVAWVGFLISRRLWRWVRYLLRNERSSRFHEWLWVTIFSLTVALAWRFFAGGPWSQELIPILCVAVFYLIFVEMRHRRRLRRAALNDSASDGHD